MIQNDRLISFPIYNALTPLSYPYYYPIPLLLLLCTIIQFLNQPSTYSKEPTISALTFMFYNYQNIIFFNTIKVYIQ